MKEWYLVYTKPKSEDILAWKFQEKGYEVFNPKIRERKYFRKKTQDVVSPFFPCYLFVRFEFPDDYRLIKYTRGVRRVVGYDNSPTVVPEEIVETIARRIEDGVIRIESAKFNNGDEVLIKGGPFEEFEAIFEKELKGMERVSILIKAINARAIVDGHLLKKK